MKKVLISGLFLSFSVWAGASMDETDPHEIPGSFVQKAMHTIATKCVRAKERLDKQEVAVQKLEEARVAWNEVQADCAEFEKMAGSYFANMKPVMPETPEIPHPDKLHDKGTNPEL